MGSERNIKSATKLFAHDQLVELRGELEARADALKDEMMDILKTSNFAHARNMRYEVEGIKKAIEVLDAFVVDLVNETTIPEEVHNG